MANQRMNEALRVRIPKPLRKRIKAIARQCEADVCESDLIRQAVREFVERREAQGTN